MTAQTNIIDQQLPIHCPNAESLMPQSCRVRYQLTASCSCPYFQDKPKPPQIHSNRSAMYPRRLQIEGAAYFAGSQIIGACRFMWLLLLFERSASFFTERICASSAGQRCQGCPHCRCPAKPATDPHDCYRPSAGWYCCYSSAQRRNR